MEALLRTVAAEGAARHFAGPLVALIWSYLARLRQRFAARIAARIASLPRPSRLRAPRARNAASPRALPRRFAWLRILLPGTAAFGAQLTHLLAEPDMAGLIAADPFLGRTLRPLCHLLGIRPPQTLRRPRPPASARKSARNRKPVPPTHPAAPWLGPARPDPAPSRTASHDAPARAPARSAQPRRRPDRSPTTILHWTGPPPHRAAG